MCQLIIGGDFKNTALIGVQTPEELNSATGKNCLKEHYHIECLETGSS
jgi:hypothetical protein